MLVVGLTGGIAAGKSTVSKSLKENHGLPVIDADVIAREVVKPGQKAYKKIITHFGSRVPDLVLDDAGNLNRAALGKYVFEHTDELKVLNSIVHPAVRYEIFRQIFRAYIGLNRLVILDVPLLFESGLDKICGLTICVVCTEEVQLERLLVRNPELSEDDARNRIVSQMSTHLKMRKADYIIDNSTTLDNLEEQIAGTVSQITPWWYVYLLELFPPFAIFSAVGRYIIRRVHDNIQDKDD